MLIAKARELKIELTDTEIDKAFAEGKKNITPDTFQKSLAARNLTEPTCGTGCAATCWRRR